MHSWNVLLSHFRACRAHIHQATENEHQGERDIQPTRSGEWHALRPEWTNCEKDAEHEHQNTEYEAQKDASRHCRRQRELVLRAPLDHQSSPPPGRAVFCVTIRKAGEMGVDSLATHSPATRISVGAGTAYPATACKTTCCTPRSKLLAWTAATHAPSWRAHVPSLNPGACAQSRGPLFNLASSFGETERNMTRREGCSRNN